MFVWTNNKHWELNGRTVEASFGGSSDVVFLTNELHSKLPFGATSLFPASLVYFNMLNSTELSVHLYSFIRGSYYQEAHSSILFEAYRLC